MSRKRANDLVYGAFFGLDEDPFRVTPDPRFLFNGEGREDRAASFLEHVRDPEGISVITGAAGSGKSLVLRWLMSELSPQQPVAMIWHPTFGRDDFVAAICARMDVEIRSGDLRARIAALHKKALETGAVGLVPVVLVDEANSIRPDVLDLLPRLLGAYGLEKPLLSIVMASDPSGSERFLDAADIPVGHEFKLEPFADDEVASYVRHRVNLAGGDGEYLFVPEALERVAALSGGIPRVINALCGKALLLGYLGDEHQITARTVDEVGRELWVSDQDRPARKVADGATLPERMELGRVPLDEPVKHEIQPTEDVAPANRPDAEPLTAPAGEQARVGPFVVDAGSGGPAVRRSPPSTVVRDEPVAPLAEKKPFRPGKLGVLTLFVLLASALIAFGPGQEMIGRVMEFALEQIRGPAVTVTQRHEALGASTPKMETTAVETVDVDPGSALGPADDAVAEEPAQARTAPAEAPQAAGGVRLQQQPPATRVDPAASVVATVSEPNVADEQEQAQLTQRRIRALMVEAVRHVNARRFVEPAGRNALDSYRHVLTLDPGNHAARSGIRSIRDRFARWARVAEGREDWVTAKGYYETALRVGPATPELQAALARMEKNSQ